MEFLASLCLGLGLAAACGFRVFMPVLALSLGSACGLVDLGPGWEWVGAWPTLAALSVAAVLELAGYYLPFVDHALDAAATPAAAVAGTLVAATQLTGADGATLHPALSWIASLILGGGVATGVQLGTVALRGVSTATTGGLGNPVVATAENTLAAGLSAASIALPVFTAAALTLALALIVRRRMVHRVKLPVQPTPQPVDLLPDGMVR
jgi:hypothetical protein